MDVTRANADRVRIIAALCAIGALAAATGVHAQATPPAGRFVVIGCISAPGTGTAAAPGPVAYILTDFRNEKTPAVYRLDGDADKLKIHVGHTVEIAGTLSPASSTASNPIAAAPLMKIEKLTWISTSCRGAKKE
jgi:hypothetical protein